MCRFIFASKETHELGTMPCRCSWIEIESNELESRVEMRTLCKACHYVTFYSVISTVSTTHHVTCTRSIKSSLHSPHEFLCIGVLRIFSSTFTQFDVVISDYIQRHRCNPREHKTNNHEVRHLRRRYRICSCFRPIDWVWSCGNISCCHF